MKIYVHISVGLHLGFMKPYSRLFDTTPSNVTAELPSVLNVVEMRV
jgi:hypothetical protein